MLNRVKDYHKVLPEFYIGGRYIHKDNGFWNYKPCGPATLACFRILGEILHDLSLACACVQLFHLLPIFFINLQVHYSYNIIISNSMTLIII